MARRQTADDELVAGRGRRESKYDNRREGLAESALLTLGERGFARTSLRDIAANSEFSHGVVHYYFRDKTELITYCVRYYKSRCVHRYDDVVARAENSADLLRGFADKLAETIMQDAPMHRLWYDLRTQSMFDPELQDEVLGIDEQLEEMIWRVVERYAELADTEPAVDPGTAYGMLDGLFERALLRHLAGDPKAIVELQGQVYGTAPRLLQ